MKEISTHFCAIEPSHISRALLMKEDISMPANSRDFPCKGKVLFEQSPTDTEAGTKWSMTFRAVTTDKFAERLNLIDPDVFNFCWIVDFPFFEKDPETGKIIFSHNPFSF